MAITAAVAADSLRYLGTARGGSTRLAGAIAVKGKFGNAEPLCTAMKMVFWDQVVQRYLPGDISSISGPDPFTDRLKNEGRSMLRNIFATLDIYDYFSYK